MPNYNKDVNSPSINYLNKDFTSLKKDLIEYAKTYYINNNTNIYKSLKNYETLGVSVFFRDLLIMLKNDSFIYYFL